MKYATQNDIARKLNVTRITVSKAMRNHPDISSETKEKVLAMAKELGYTPNLIATQLNSRKTSTIGVVVPDLENSFFAYAIDSIIDAATIKNYHVIVTVSRENARLEEDNIRRLIGMRVEGMLICVSQNTESAPLLEQVHQMGVPFVFFDRTLVDFTASSVVFDDFHGTSNAMQILINAGYKNIAHFAGTGSSSIGRLRHSSFESVMKANNLTVNPQWVIEGGFEVKDGYDSFMKLIELHPFPELILAVNDRVAMGIYKAAREKNLQIPHDIGVVAYGSDENTHAFNPTLSVIRQDPRLLGAQAFNLLFEHLTGNNRSPLRIALKEEFVAGNSTKPVYN